MSKSSGNDLDDIIQPKTVKIVPPKTQAPVYVPPPASENSVSEESSSDDEISQPVMRNIEVSK